MLLGINTIPNISGLGSAFIARSPLTYIVQSLYQVVLRKPPLVFFQNEEDRRPFVQARPVKDERHGAYLAQALTFVALKPCLMNSVPREEQHAFCLQDAYCGIRVLVNLSRQREY